MFRRLISAFNIILILLLCASGARAQNVRQWQRACLKALSNEDPQTALFYAARAWQKDTMSGFTALLMAQSYYAAHQYYQSATWSSSGLTKKLPADRQLAAQQLLAESYYRLKQYDQASEMFKTLGQTADVERCNKARAIQATNDKVFNLGPAINTGYSEFSPLIQGDSLLFASLRFENPLDKHKPQRSLSRMMVTTNGKKAAQLPKLYNAPDVHNAHFTYTTDDQILLFTRCQWQEGMQIRCAIWQMQKNTAGRWGKPTEVAELNSTGTNTHPHIFFDSLDRVEKLIFVSDRPGGSGSKDLWISIRNKKTWLAPTPLTQLNTPGNEQTPHFNASQQLLYFSTDGRFSLGGQDIYSAKRTAAGFDSITHLLPPINSGYEDLYFVTEPCGCSGVFASNRPGSAYLDADNKTCCFDLYGVVFDKPTPTDIDSTPVVTNIPPTTTTPPVVVPPPVIIPPPTIEDFVGLFLFFDNDQPNPRSTKTTTTLSYSETFDPYYNRLTDYLDNYTNDDSALADSVLAFFNNEVLGNYQKWLEFQELLLKQLQSGKQISISLRGYTSPRAQSRYNDYLAARRVAAVLNDLKRSNDGVLQLFIQSGQLKVIPVAYGESRAASSVSDNIDDARNSIYAPAAARERRVEIVKIVIAN